MPAEFMVVKVNEVVASGLPAGAATSALQGTGNTSLASIDGKLTNAATSALQSTGNNSLASIDGKLPNLFGGAIPCAVLGIVPNGDPDGAIAPVKAGAKSSVSALPVAVGDASVADNLSDRYGRQLVSHIDPGLQNWKAASYTTAQTGTNLWVPAAGKRLAITSLMIATGGTTPGRVTVWLAVTADTSYNEGTDQVLFDADLIPSATLTQQIFLPFPVPVFSQTTIACLKVTTSTAMTVRFSAYGYEFTP